MSSGSEKVFLAALVFGAAIGITGCNETATLTPASAAEPVTVPVGPLPGVASQPPSQADPYAKDPIALTDGRKFFIQYNCYGCHGGHAGGGMGPSLRDASWIYGSEDAEIFASIAQGRAHGMPSWASRLPQEQIWKLVAYIKSLRTPQEPDPPEQE